MLHLLEHTFIDSIKLLPFLFLTYLAMEFLEHQTGDNVKKVIQKSGRFSPIIGSLLGIVPQCGFSAAASNLYAGRIITLGTLLAIFLSTSDEMLPILISSSASVGTIVKILTWKVAIAVVAGLVIDFIIRRKGIEKEMDIHQICEHEHCHCEKGIFSSAIKHTLQIFVFIFIISFVLNIIMHSGGEDVLAELIFNQPILGVLLAALVGLIPNCASSVLITQLYLEGAMGFGAMMAGLLVGAGVGILVLCRVVEKKKECAQIIALLYVIGAAAGIILELVGITV